MLAGCSSEGGGAYQEYGQILRQSFSNSFGKSGITRAQAAGIPYASLGFRIDGGKEALLVLATDTNGDQIWTAASHVVLLIRGGRIVRTVGLPRNIAGTASASGTALPPLQDALKGSYHSSRVLDFPDQATYGLVLNCVTSAAGPQSISIIGAAISTMRVNETCRSANGRWSFTDTYWIDPTSGFCWHSVQHLHPSGMVIQTEIFRPPG